MKPLFYIESDGGLNEVLEERLLQVRVVDENGIEADSMEIQLDDRGNGVPIPEQGSTVAIWIGYENHPVKRLNGIKYFGRYTIDEVHFRGPPQTVTIGGKAANLLEGIKSPRVWEFRETTIGDVVRVLAKRHGLQPIVDEALDAIEVPHIDQSDESDMHLLRRLAEQYDALAKPVDGKLVFAEHAQRRLKRGLVEVVELPPWQESTYEISYTGRAEYSGCIAYWYDKDAGRRVEEFYGEKEKEGPVHKMRHDFRDQQQAKDAAERTLYKMVRGKGALRLSLPGNQLIRAEKMIRVPTLEWGLKLEGTWLVSRVEHTITGTGGFSTSLDAETPGEFENPGAASGFGLWGAIEELLPELPF